jgi:hypothetical protein
MCHIVCQHYGWISTGTTLGARIIDQRKLDTSQPKLTGDLSLVDAKLTELKSLPDDSEAKLRMQEFEEQRAAIKDKIDPKSKGLWNDIMSDSYGTSLHRLQAVMWTIVFGLIFSYKVYQDLAMPEFSPTRLSLMGIIRHISLFKNSLGIIASIFAIEQHIFYKKKCTMPSATRHTENDSYFRQHRHVSR